MSAVGPHHQIVAARLAVARARQHLAAMLLDGCNADAHAHGWTTGRRGQYAEQLAAAELTDRTERSEIAPRS